jgi:hypothetical protein
MSFRLLGTVFSLLLVSMVRAQDDRCEAIKAILRDAPNEFRNVRTNLTESGYAMRAYKSGIHVPGTINERFVAAYGMFYEGAIVQTNTIDSIRPHYEALKQALAGCLAEAGFSASERTGFDPEVKMFPKVAFLPKFDKNTDYKALKGHVAMEVDYNKMSKRYTLELFIYHK